jgi:uncharacterized damage-inducible protein DinB
MNAREQFGHWAIVRQGLMQALGTLTDEQLDYAPREGMRSLGAVARHIAHVEEAWFRYWMVGKHEGPPEYTAEDCPTVASIKALLAEVHHRTEAYLETLDIADLDGPFETFWGQKGPISWVVWRVLEHEIHHRGEIYLMLGLVGMTADAVQAVVHDAHAQLDAVLEQIDEDRMVEPHYVFDDWTVKDVLVHLTAWERLESGWIEAVVRGETPELYAPGFEWGGVHHPQSWEAICRYNAHVLEEGKNRPLEDVLAELRATQQRALEVVGRLPERVLTGPSAFFWLGVADRDPWRPIPIESCEHYFEHINLIHSWMEREE